MAFYSSANGVQKSPSDFMPKDQPKRPDTKPGCLGPEVFHAFAEVFESKE